MGKYLKGKDPYAYARARVNTHTVGDRRCVSWWRKIVFLFEFRLEMDWNRRSVPSNRTRGSREGSDRKLALIRRPRFCSL